jgi:hypothetical protein
MSLIDTVSKSYLHRVKTSLKKSFTIQSWSLFPYFSSEWIDTSSKVSLGENSNVKIQILKFTRIP